MSRVLVTGARGMLGSHVVLHLRECGHDVVEHARRPGADIHADLTDARQVEDMLSRVKPDVIVNLAAMANVEECERHPQLAYLANVRIVENIAGWMLRKGGDGHLVHISTDQVYDGKGEHCESDVTLSNYYAFSKYAGELVAARVPSTILRTNFFGPSRCQTRMSLSDWLVRSLMMGESITVFCDVLFSPLRLDNLSRLLVKVVETRTRGLFNLGSREGMSKADFAFALARELALPTHTMKRGNSGEGQRAYRPKDMRMDSSHFEEVFGVQLPALKEEIHFVRNDYAHRSQ